jgi:hypothetical protein
MSLSGTRNSQSRPDRKEVEPVFEIGDGHFDVEEDQTTLSADSRKPCQPNVKRRSTRGRGRNLGYHRKALLTRAGTGAERVSERVPDTGMSVRRKG